MSEKNTEASDADLVKRLDVLAEHLRRIGEVHDAALVREAVAALDKPTVVGTPWTMPLKGDKCVRSDGASREAVSVVYRQNWPTTSGKPETAWGPTDGYHASLVDYRNQKGREDTISASSWATWCRAACRNGGAYTRVEAQP